jgi:hypothetical protein
MRLEPSNAEPGLWVNLDCQAGEPGTFAVVIGVSRYAHLADGEAPARETYGLGQLKVSALTAFEVFRWLAERFQVEGCPLARCWLLLSPTDEERAHEPRIADHLTLPSFDNCKKALRCWRQHMQDLPRPAAEQSRALFFFSGHGLELYQEHQVLLPSDYLAPPSPSWNDAISTDNLKKGLASLAVPHQFFFLDACRNDYYALRSKQVTGADLLSEDESALVNAVRIAPLLYATASGQQAFQPSEPIKGLSLFGRALLDGLVGTPEIALACQGSVCSVNLYPLHGYVKQRVAELLAQAGAQVGQPVKLSGIVDNEPITYLDRAAVQPRPAPPVRRRIPHSGVPEAVFEAPAEASRVERLLQSVFTHTRLVEPLLRRRSWFEDLALGHDLFGSEQVTEVLTRRLKLYALGKRRWVDPEMIALHAVERDEGASSYRAEVAIEADDRVGHWLQLTDMAGTAYACVLPSDRTARPHYQVEFDITRDDAGLRLNRLEAYLSANSPSPLGVAADLWQRYRTADLGEAVSAFEMSALERMVREKLESPLAATVAALVLLRANRLDLLHDWLRNLAHWFDERPDGPALWAEQLMRQQAGKAIEEAADYLAELLPRGLPHTSEGLSYAARLSDTLSRLGNRVPQPPRLAALAEHIRHALPLFRPGGLFTSYAGFDPAAEPSALIGPFDPASLATPAST